MKTSKMLAIAAAAMLLGTGSLAFAAQGGAHGNGHGDAGGMSGSHMSDDALLNTNGPNAADRDTGRQRAADRMSQKGVAHHHVASLTKHHHKHHPLKLHTKPGTQG